jgi:hypothetical protein
MLWLLAFAGVISELACVAADPGDDCCQVVQCAMCAQGAICDTQAPVVAFVPTVAAAIPSEVTQPDSPELGRLSPPPRF